MKLSHAKTGTIGLTTRSLPVQTSEASADKRISAAARDLRFLRRALHYKLKQKSKLTAVEIHLLKNFSSLENKLLGPSLMSTVSQCLRAFFRPSFAMALVGLALLPGASSSMFGSSVPKGLTEAIAEEAFTLEVASLPVAQIQVSIPELAIALDTAHSAEAAAIPVAEVLPEIPPLEIPVVTEVPAPVAEVTQVQTAALKLSTTEVELKKQRNLVKFISGIIAAFRPSITDSGAIARHIVELSAEEHFDPIYVAAVIAIESRFSSSARSSVGATGLMQLMPATAREIADSKNHKTSHLVDPRVNIRLGIRYLKELNGRYQGNRFLALAAYNWGPANVGKVKGKLRRIPGSVKNYSNTVLERTLAWNRHFTKANESADALQAVQLKQPAENKS